MLLSGRALVDVPTKNQRFLEDYIDMSLIKNTIGSGALKHVWPAPGQEHTVRITDRIKRYKSMRQVFNILRRKNVIPQVKVYRTDARQSDLPDWYWYYRSERIAPLLLISLPGYSIRTVRFFVH